ncbi:MAG: exodeoxyribonuclease VII small subunit [Proteobacteria bacterium]|nr:exodeoxyribonuclease VII small subunit [Pseudomonadota bacterium]
MPPDIAALSFEEAMAELEKLVRQLEGGQTKLEDAISAYERGAMLRRHCAGKLKEVELRIEKIAVLDDGSLQATTTTL